MLDAVKGSPDGTKSAHQVAQEHVHRVQKIIDASDIKDKSTVHIVQISARAALKARIGKGCSQLLQTSNYQKLVDTVNMAFEQVRPRIENHRLNFLKKEIIRIAEDANKNSCGLVLAKDSFEFENTIAQMTAANKSAMVRLQKHLKALKQVGEKIDAKTTISEYDLDRIVEEENKCEAAICREMNETNNYYTSLATKLNVDARNILSDFRLEKPSAPRMRKKTEVYTETVKADKAWYKPWTWFRSDTYETRTKNVTDHEQTKADAVRHIDKCCAAFSNVIERWHRSIGKSEEKIQDEIDNRRQAFEAHKNKFLEAQQYQMVARQLRDIADKIPAIAYHKPRTEKRRNDDSDTTMHSVEVSNLSYHLSRLANNIKSRIHQSTMQTLLNGGPTDHIVIGWDKICEQDFVWYGFGIRANDTNIHEDVNSLTYEVSVIHKPRKPLQTYLKVSRPLNVFVLVNATQIGSAEKEIDRCKLANRLTRRDHLFFVIQDLQEIINGDALSETIDNIKNLGKQLAIPLPATTLFLHDNPIYNLAAIEAQKNVETHADEVRVMNNLQNGFRFLIEGAQKGDIEAGLSLITKKLHRI